MTKHEEDLSASTAMAETFGALSLLMLDESDLRHAWRINFIANFFTGPLYRRLGEEHGVTRPEFVILYCLKHMPGLVAQDICRVTGQPKNSISRAVSDLLRKEYVERGTDPTDRRAKPLSLTSSGRRILGEIEPMVEARQVKMRSVLNEEEQAQFDALVRKMVFAMPNWATPDQ